MSEVAFAVVGGTGLYRLASLDDISRHELDTPYGRPSGAIVSGQLGGRRTLFLARHGEGHSLAPHEINYRANLWALRELGAQRIVAINAVGGISEQMAPRVLAIPDDLIDYTWGRAHTYYENAGKVEHVDLGNPYDTALRRALLDAARQAGVDVVDGGVYGATQGPRLETPAEIRRMARDGCDLVGMTGMPEAALARELGVAYASIALVANWAAGCGDQAEITLDEVLANVEACSGQLPGLLKAIV